MSGLGLAAPLGLALGLLAVPLVLLYVLKLRRRPVRVSSTWLWRAALLDRRANAPWERLRRHLLLLLQLVALALLVLAFAAPFAPSEESLAPDTAIVLDGSASMLAGRASGGTRFDEAVRAARRMVRAVQSGRRVTIVLAGPTAEVLVPLTDDRAALDRGLDGARAVAAPADVRAAVDLGRTLVATRGGGEVALVTDGAMATDPVLDAALAGVRVVVPSGSEDAENVGVVALALRPLPGTRESTEVFVAVESRAGDERVVPIVLESLGEASGRAAPAEVARVEAVLRPGERRAEVLRVDAPPGTHVRARVLASGPDALRVDDVADAVVPGRPALRVLVASDRPFVLSRALAALDSVQVHETPDTGARGDGYDLVAIHGDLPPVLPDAPVLAFGRTPAASAVPGSRLVRWDRRHPALRHADLDGLVVGEAWQLSVPPSAETVLEGESGPLAAAWIAPGGRALVFGFDLLESDLPLRVAFPVLVSDAVDWLVDRAPDPAVVASGQPVRLHLRGQADERGTSLRLRAPSGAERPVAGDPAGAVLLPPATEPGVHALLAGDGELVRAFGVALLSPVETDLSARVAPRVAAGDAAGRAGDARVPGRRPLWPWVIACAIGALLVEWGVHHRRAGA